MKNRYIKIGISLLIALCFILPTGVVLSEGNEAAITQTNSVDKLEQLYLDSQNKISPMMRTDGTAIEQATNTQILNVYMEKCDVEDDKSKIPLTGVPVNINGRVAIPYDDCYTPVFQLLTTDIPTRFEPEIEIYEIACGDEFCIYETSFEDNARNYLEWQQIDFDCGIVGGYYDGWSWSDARACCGDHSFKNTMYDEYKNMQMDVLMMKQGIDLTQDEYVLCDGTLLEDVDINTVNVSFDIFVDGEWAPWSNSYEPLDFLEFWLSDGTGFYSVLPWPFADTSMDLYDFFGVSFLGFAQKSDCPGWWHVWYEIDPSQLPLSLQENFGIAFYWESDKERVYEGAYVDCIEITITDETQNKVYQGHSQSWLTEEDVNTPIGIWKFPLDWTGFRETINKVDCDDQDCSFYRAVCKIKTDDGGYLEPLIIDFEIGEVDMNAIVDLLIEDDFNHVEVPDGGILDYPSDAHIKFTYHNGGSVPVTDVPVKATAYSLVEETLAEYDMESGFSYYYFVGADQIYLSNDFAWSGTRSMAFNNPETMHYDTCSFYGMLFGDPIDMQCVEDVCLDFYYFGKVGPGTSFQFIAGSEASGVTLDMRDFWTGLEDNQKTGVNLDSCDSDCIGKPAKWIGPLQPICSYSCIDLDAVWEQVEPYALGANGEQTYGLLYGFSLGGSGPTGWWSDTPDKGVFYLCGPNTEETDWSGVYVDDVTVTAKVMGEKVWSETMILPGPIDPCETVTDQFDWEDPDFSCYRIVVEVPGCTDPFSCYTDEEYWYKYSDFCVLEAKEKMTKQTDTDYSDCTPEAWCISDVVGNDCGNGIDPETGEFIEVAPGDHYALATNCDTYTVPQPVNDYIALGPADDECDTCTGPMDISHLYVAGAGGPGGGPVIDMFEFDGLSMIFSGGWVQVDPALASFDIEFYDDPYAEHTIPFDEFVTSFSAGPALSSTPGDVYAGFYQAYRWEIPCPDVQLADLEGGIYMTETAAGGGCLWGNSGDGDGWSYQEAVGPTTDGDRAMTLFDGAHILFDQTVIDPLGAWSFINIDQSLGYGGYESFFLTPAIAGHAMDLNCTVVIDEGFEDEFNWPPIGWTTYGFFPDQGPEYGEPSHTGIHHLYTNSAGDSAVTPTIWFRDENTLSFWYAVESSSYPQDLEVYVDGAGSPIWSLYNFDNEDYIQVVLTNELDPYANGNHTIEFYNPRTAFTFGSMVDDVIVETCIQEGPDIVPNEIWVNFTYQVDMDVGEVIVEYVMYNATEDCCPPGETAWTTLGDPIFGRYPGACQFFSQPLTVTHNNLCLRLRLDTRDLPYEIWGIGFHMHEIFISDIVHDAFDNMTYNFYEDFEDGTLTIPDQPGEAPNLAWCIDCVKYGEHWSDIDDFTFICGGTEIPGYMPLECQDFKFVGIDTYGDGWWYPYTYIDIYVNGVQVVDDFTLPPYNTPYAEVEFEACGGDIIGIDVEIQSPSYWPYEMEFYLYDASGNKWWSDGENGGTPSPGLTEIELPLEAFVIPPGAYWPAEPIDTACVWETEIEDCYEAYLYGEWMYSLPSGCQVTVEVSVDGGDNWFIIAQLDGPAEQLSWVQIPCTIFDLTAFVGNKILVRTHVDNYGANPGFLMIRNYEIYGKQDMIPPTIAISLSGNNIGGNMYAGPVTVTLTATDNKGVKEIHYIVDGGAETIVAGDTATFTVSGDGDHTVTAWAVDIVNNVGASASASFSIDATPPTVAITAPEPGLYLFGNQLLSMSKPFIIGAFTIEATADDAQGVAYVEFFINGESLGADLEAPYSAYCAVKNMGAAEISAVAVDGVGNSAEDSLDVTYYKFL